MKKADVIKKAEEFCKKHKIDKTPVGIVALCEQYGLKVFERVLPIGVSGFIVYLPDNDNSQTAKGIEAKYGTKKCIVVNSLDKAARRRFTVAHELAHFILHRKSGEEIYAHRDAGHSGTQENEANLFASNILMPEKLVKRAIADLKNDYWGEVLYSEKVSYIANEFAVSLSAVRVRFDQLGIS